MAEGRDSAMRTERVILPEPGRTLLRRTYGILSQRLRGGSGQAGFIIGGGTMLAARWKHRNSKDLDVKVNDTEGCRAISRMADEPMLETALDREMQAVGAWTKQRAGRLQLVYVFGDERDADPPRIDLAELPPKLKREVIRTESEGMQFWSASNEEILAGKWKDRREDPPVRDVFDFAMAGLMDGHALQRALTTDGTADDLDKMIERLAARRRQLQDAAVRTIEGVPQEHEQVRRDPARFAARAIGMWALTEITIAQGEGTWVVETRCRAEPEGTERGRYEGLDAAAERAGELGGFTHEDITDIREEAERQGGSRRRCEGSGITQTTGPEMVVDARGTVLIRDFGEAPVRAATISAGVEVAIERGWESGERRQEVMKELTALQQQAIAHERTRMQ